MPSRTKQLDRTVANLPSIPKELVAQFLTGPMTGAAIDAAGDRVQTGTDRGVPERRTDAPPGLRDRRGEAGGIGQPFRF